MDKLLTQFMAVAEAGNISNAATALFVTQPTLSFNMRKLEEQLGLKLLVRKAHGVELTEYGRTLYQNAQLMRRLYDNTLDALARQRGRTEQALRIGSGYSWWTLFIRDLVMNYSRTHPDAHVHVTLGNQLRCMDQLLSGDIALFIAHEIEGLSRSTGTRFIPLTRVGQGYFVRQGHPLLDHPRRLAEIDAYPAVSSAPPEMRHQRFFEAWSRAASDKAPFDQGRYVFASNSLAACLDYVERSDAVINHTALMADEIVRRGLRSVTVDEPTRQDTIGIYLLDERSSEPKVAELLEAVQLAAAAVLPPLKVG